MRDLTRDQHKLLQEFLGRSINYWEPKPSIGKGLILVSLLEDTEKYHSVSETPADPWSTIFIGQDQSIVDWFYVSLGRFNCELPVSCYHIPDNPKGCPVSPCGSLLSEVEYPPTLLICDLPNYSRYELHAQSFIQALALETIVSDGKVLYIT